MKRWTLVEVCTLANLLLGMPLIMCGFVTNVRLFCVAGGVVYASGIFGVVGMIRERLWWRN